MLGNPSRTRRRWTIAILPLPACVLLAFTSAASTDLIYVSSSTMDAVLSLTPDGNSSIFASDCLRIPNGIAFDTVGNLYVANYGSNSITKITPAGVSSCFSTNGLIRPSGIACDRSGNLYVSNQGAYNSVSHNYDSYIQKFSPSGSGWIFAGAQGRDPRGLACDAAGNLYVAERDYHRIGKFNPAGSAFLISIRTGTNRPQDLVLDSADNIYVCYGPAGTIEKFSATGVSLGIIASGMLNPVSLAFDRAGNLYVANYVYSDEGSIDIITPSGVRSVFAAVRAPSFIKTFPLPLITAEMAGAQMLLKWPTNAVGFALECSTNFPSSSSWAGVTNNVVTVGSNCTVSLNPNLPGQFFRLKR